MLGTVIRHTRSAVLVVLAASVAATGWARAPRTVVRAAPAIAIDDVRPLQTRDAALRDLITHTFAVHLRISGWRLLPYQPGASARDNQPGAGHWRLYLDGQALGDNLGNSRRTYLYVSPGTHWIAGELSNADSTSLRPPIWSEPVILHVPRVVRCWQTGPARAPTAGPPRFTCHRPTTDRRHRT